MVGVELIREQMNVEAFNAISNPADLGDFVITSSESATLEKRKWSARDRAAPPLCWAAPVTSPVSCCGCSPGIRASHCRILSTANRAAVAAAFPHLRGAYPELKSAASTRSSRCFGELLDRRFFRPRRTVVAAGIIDRLLTAAETAGTQTHCSTSRQTFAMPAPTPTNPVQTRACAPRVSGNLRARSRNTCPVADTACFSSRMLCDGHPIGQRPALALG